MKKKILIVDDDREFVEELKEIFLYEGYEVLCKYSGVSVIAAVIKEKPSIILLDLRMPDKNGFEVEEELETDPGASRVPVIIISGNDADESFAELNRKKNVRLCITKPPPIPTLISAVKRITCGNNKTL
ncbi:MAG: response regulator [Elusimicrobia bacterium]|nr:response regulator [Elusimicrobiota bacterium]MBD3412163.1 response regulator [Elusimicrobiota bacterium]